MAITTLAMSLTPAKSPVPLVIVTVVTGATNTFALRAISVTPPIMHPLEGDVGNMEFLDKYEIAKRIDMLRNESTEYNHKCEVCGEPFYIFVIHPDALDLWEQAKDTRVLCSECRRLGK